MHSRRLLLLWPALVASLAAASCHLPNGQEADEDWVPCNKVDAFSLCCRDGDVCLESGRCLTPSGPRPGACQNADWVGCHWDDPAVVDLKARQDVTTTIIVDGGPAAPSTVVVIATATQIQSFASTADPTSETAPAATTATAEPTSEPSSKSTNLGPIIGGAVGGAAVLAGFVFALFYIHRRRERKRRLDAEIRASIQSDWLGQVEVGSGKRYDDHDHQQQQFGIGGGGQEKPRTPPPGASGGKTPEPYGGHGAVEIDDGRMHPVPVEMESPPPPQVSNKPPWVVPKGVYEIG